MSMTSKRLLKMSNSSVSPTEVVPRICSHELLHASICSWIFICSKDLVSQTKCIDNLARIIAEKASDDFCLVPEPNGGLSMNSLPQLTETIRIFRRRLALCILEKRYEVIGNSLQVWVEESRPHDAQDHEQQEVAIDSQRSPPIPTADEMNPSQILRFLFPISRAISVMEQMRDRAPAQNLVHNIYVTLRLFEEAFVWPNPAPRFFSSRNISQQQLHQQQPSSQLSQGQSEGNGIGEIESIAFSAAQVLLLLLKLNGIMRRFSHAQYISPLILYSAYLQSRIEEYQKAGDQHKTQATLAKYF